jgi:hypothetical protein
VLRTRIQIKVKSRIRIRIKLKIQELRRLIMELWRLIIELWRPVDAHIGGEEAQNGAIEGLKTSSRRLTSL